MHLDIEGLFAPAEAKMLNQINTFEEAIQACAKKNFSIQALILLYSAIELVGSLDNDDPKAKEGEIFQKWVKKYLLPVRMLYCNALDLWASRCGLTHAVTPESRLSKAG